jgi:hypothetical protein
MNREEWQFYLDLAEKCVAEGLALIEKQSGIIEELERNGCDTKKAKDFLGTLFESQGRYERHRDRLQDETGLTPSRALSEEESLTQALVEGLRDMWPTPPTPTKA